MTDFKNIHLLIVDDEDDIREMFADLFEECGAIIYQASNGNEAFEIIKTHKIDVVISDIKMPKGDGIELLCKIKDQDVFKPAVILISGFTDANHQDLYNMGADAYFPKPCNINSLFEAVQRLSSEVTHYLSSNLNESCDYKKVNLSLGLYTDEEQKNNFKLGRRGAFIKIPTSLQVSQVIEFKIAFYNQSNSLICLEGQAICRWVNLNNESYVIGIEFVRLEKDSLKLFQQIVKEKKSRASIPCPKVVTS